MNNRIRHICIITAGYPTDINPRYNFVAQLVNTWADSGIECTVISPQSVDKNLKKSEKQPRKREVNTTKGNKITVYSPRYMSFSNKYILGYNTSAITLRNFYKASSKEFKKRKLSPDVIYAHFINPAGISAVRIGEEFNIPTFIANGESSPKLYEILGKERVSKELKNINGIVSVSSHNKKLLVDRNILNSEKIKVFPNAIDGDVFYKKDKIEVRKKLGYNKDDFIIIFVGHFNHRKGSQRLSQALDRLEDVKSIFIGDGSDRPTCDGILHSGKVPHNEIADMLNAADAFVLPTLNEGCCNAIIEAMACGLPIISSDLPFNDDILDKENSIRIDSNSIDQIANSITLLKESPQKRNCMSSKSLIKSKDLDIQTRAKRILQFFEKSGD